MLQGSRFRELRLKNKFTHDSMAQALGIAVRMVGKYEAGEADPSSDVVTRMADAFNVSADYLLGRTDDPTPPAHSADLSPHEQAILAALRRDDLLTAVRLIVQTNHKPDSNLPI